MKNSNFIIRIPEPCHEDWNSMQPDAKGKFCNSCSKSVFDFSTKTDTEIRDILVEYKDQKVCGHFKKTQIDRTLNMSINLRDLPKNISMTKAFAIALFLVFGTFLFSCTNEQGQKVDSIEIVNSVKEGMVLGDLSFAAPPPSDFIVGQNEMISGDTIMTIDTLIETKTNYMESTIDGGISFEEVPYIEDVIPEPVNQLITESFTTGSMAVYIEEPKDTITPDSISTIASKTIVEQDDIIKETSFGIYPNPSNGEFTFKYDVLKRTDISLDIFDMKGVLVKTIVCISNQYEEQYQIPVNLSELTNGIYLVNLINNGKKFTERLVIEK